MEAIKNFWKRIYGYYKKNDKKPAAVPQNGEAEPKSMDGVKESRAKPSGSGLNKKHVIGAFGIIALFAMYSIMLGAGKEGSHINKGEEKESRTVTVSNGTHLRDVPADYTEEGQMEQEKKPAVKEDKKARAQVKAVQPRPTLPRQPARQQKPRLTLEQQERVEEYEAMKKAYQSPIRFELKE